MLFRSGVVDHRVDRSQLPFGLVEEVLEGGVVGDVEPHRDGATTQLAGGLLGQLEVEVADRDLQPLRTSAAAVALPIPRAPPVIATTLPLSERRSFAIVLLLPREATSQAAGL